MPRRKQEAPRRSAAYVPDELKAAVLGDDETEASESGADGDSNCQYACEEQEFSKEAATFHDSPTAELSGQEVDSTSHASETSDRLADFESHSVKNEEESKEGVGAGEEGGVQDSLEQMKVIYNNILSNSYWSSLSLGLTQPGQPVTNGGSSSSSSSSSGGSSCESSSFDWHQSAMSKTLQQVSQSRFLQEPGLFSTVQLYRQSSKLYGSIFSGASKFRCKDCSAAYDTLVDLTVHMNETGHYRDENNEADNNNPRKWSKPRKRSLLEMEGKEDAQKVLKCMYCGHSFESLQDLSVHMIKTKHYQKVPLKEPVSTISTKVLPSSRKRLALDLDLPSSPDSTGGTANTTALSDTADPLHKSSNPYVTPNNRYGHQNGASYAWQFEARKSQILKCMECGSSHDTLQELTAHMMVTGHFVKVTNSAIKKGKQMVEAPPTPAPAVTSLLEDKVQSVPLAASAFTASMPTPGNASPKLNLDLKREADKDSDSQDSDQRAKEKVTPCGKEEKYDISSKYQYLTEQDLEDNPRGGLDILKSLENTVTSAINKAQNGTPSWSGYPSIHAAYQLPGIMKLPCSPSGKHTQLKSTYTTLDGMVSPKGQPLVSSPNSQNSPLPKNNFHAMEKLVKKVSEKVSRHEERVKEPESKPCRPKRGESSPCLSEVGEAKSEASTEAGPQGHDSLAVGLKQSARDSPHREQVENGTDSLKPMCSSTAIITDHPPEQPFINPLSALQSVMNVHLGKAAKPALPSLDPMSMLYKMSNSLADKAALASPLAPAKKAEAADRYFYHHTSSDQPIDLTKAKADKGGSLLGLACVSPSSTSSTCTVTTTAKTTAAVVSFMSSSPLRENALSDISDMLKNLTGSHTSKSSTPTSGSDRSEVEGSTLEDNDDISPAQKRKGRQSNWNPQHLLILQAQFAASLRQTAEGKFIMSDLSPQERMHISRFTGLSMTTISHWLANVKYQLRRTGGTKFLKNLDSGHPVFFCNDCASQIRTPSTYISHLESHLGFRLRDLSRLSSEQLGSQITHTKLPCDKAALHSSHDEEGVGVSFQCKLCNRTFGSKHAVKLHLSKTHGKSPEDHLLYVTELEKP